MSGMRRPRRRYGFSLLELSVALVVVSLVVGFGVTGGRNAVEGSSRVATQQRLATIQKALDGFAKLNGYLPCPARRDLTPSSASFGMESRSGTSCSVTGDIKNVPTGATKVYIGAVPARTLGLPDSYAADSWSNKFLYAVSQNHVGNPFSYATADGTITVKYGNRSGTNYAITTDRTGAAGPAATYVVVSHGPDGKGAYPLIGSAAARACGNVTNHNDVENCDQLDAVFYASAYTEGSGTSSFFFDDYIVWGSNALERSPMAVEDASSSGTCLSGGGTACEYDINLAGTAPDCDTTCSNAGYSASGASVTNCTYNATTCTQGGKLSCNYQCCCSGTPPSGCAPATGVTWDSGNCAGDVPVLPHGQSTTVLNTLPGYTGQETATCTNGTLGYSAASCTALAPTSSSTSSTSSTSTSSSTGGRAGCSTGNCSEWCAPCKRSGGGGRVNRQLCEKFLISENPCQAQCIYAGCGCFIGETLITMADGSKKPISELKVGDAVRGETQVNKVVHPETHHSSEMLYGFNKGKAFVTGEHLLMTTKGWRAIDPELVKIESNGTKTAEKLVVGDTLVMAGGGTLVIESIDGEMRKDMTLFNPALDGDHTYYANGILVHNLKMGGSYGCWSCP